MADPVLATATDTKPGRFEPVVQELRARYEYASEKWGEIRKEGTTDIRYVAGDPWTPADRKMRAAADRPILALDELGQYVNQLINSIRQHKRAIKVTPIGVGANEDTARFRADLIRQIEYRSNAPSQAYTIGFENTVQRSYGFWRVAAKYAHAPKASGADGTAFNQELWIEAMPNPDLVTPDPDMQSPTGADMKFCFVGESWALSDYRKKFPKARIQNFSRDLEQPGDKAWVGANRIQIAEYWTVDSETREMGLFAQADVQKAIGKVPTPWPSDVGVFMDELDQPEWAMFRGLNPIKTRDVDVPTVKRYLTNGFEMLEPPKTWPGTTIPIVACLGKQLYVDTGSGPERKVLSLVRLARDPYMLYCYYRTAQAELIGMSTKFPYFVRRGSLKPDQLLALQKSLHEPVAAIEVEADVPGGAPGFVPEMPVRNPFVAEVERLEMGAEGARRSIQAAMGSSPLPTVAQRRNEKSGVALREMKDAEQQGSYHFVDSYEAAITRTGQILDEVIPVYYDTPRDVTVRSQTDEATVIRINDVNIPKGQEKPVMATEGQHDITLSTGPSYDSEREAASDFADTFIANVTAFAAALPPGAAAKLISLAVKLKNLGPIGDEMAETIAPQPAEDGQPNPDAVKQQIAQAQKLIDALTKELNAKNGVIETEQVKADNALKLKMLDIQFQREKLERDSETKLAVAELGAKVDRLALFLEERARLGTQAHEVGMAAMSQAHEAGMTAMAHGQEAEQADLTRQHEQAVAAAAPEVVT